MDFYIVCTVYVEIFFFKASFDIFQPDLKRPDKNLNKLLFYDFF